MFENILIFRTDRIGDLIVTCPCIITIKKYLKNSNITFIASEKNYSYAKSLNIFDTIYEFPRKGIINKIIFLVKLRKKKFDIIFVFDGKERSIISTALIPSVCKVALTSKIKLYYKIFKINFFKDTDDTNLNSVFQSMLNYSNVKNKIENFDFLNNKNDNGFSKNISIKDFIHIHLDEKWFSDFYIKTYTNINPRYDEFINFLDEISKVNNILITTGINELNIINQLKNKFFEKISDKIFIKKNLNKLIYLIYKPSFDDIESLLRNSKILIACHGAITHASNSFNVKKIDILEEGKIKFYKRFTSYLDDYHPIFRSKFDILKEEICQKILNF